MSSTKTGTRSTLPALLARRFECKNSNGSVRGTAFVSGVGRLPAEYVEIFRAAQDAGRLVYVVYSYATPIAWVEETMTDGERWIIPEVKYSVTTTNHQGLARVAAARSGNPVSL